MHRHKSLEFITSLPGTTFRKINLRLLNRSSDENISKTFFKIIEKSENSNQLHHLVLATLFLYDYLQAFILKFRNKKKNNNMFAEKDSSKSRS